MGFYASGTSPLARGSVSGEMGRWVYDWSQDLSAKGVVGLPVSRNVTRIVGTG